MRIGKFFVALFLVFGSLIMLMPFVIMVSGSLQSYSQFLRVPPSLIPNPVKWDNYVKLFQSVPFGLYMFNSIKVAFLRVVGVLWSCSMVGYALARMEFPGRDFLFKLNMATMLLPIQVTMIPTFILMNKIHWVDTHLPLWVPGFFCGGAFGVFLMRQFYLTLPKELEDAAVIDGANPLVMYHKIFLPLAKPALASLTVFTFMSSWGNLTNALIYLSTRIKYTLPIGLSFLTGQFVGNEQLVLGGAFLSLLPILIIYLVAQRYFVSGIATTGLKG